MALASRLARTALFALAVSGYVAAAAARVGTAPFDWHASGFAAAMLAQGKPATATVTTPATPDLRATLDTYCIACHNQRLKTAGLTLDTIDAAPHTNPEVF